MNYKIIIKRSVDVSIMELYMTHLYVVGFFFVYRDSPSSYRRKDSVGQSTVSNHNRSESATIGKQNRYQTTTLTRFGDSLSHRNPYPVSYYSQSLFIFILLYCLSSKDYFSAEAFYNIFTFILTPLRTELLRLLYNIVNRCQLNVF